jgi:hypothetical protein
MAHSRNSISKVHTTGGDPHKSSLCHAIKQNSNLLSPTIASKQKEKIKRELEAKLNDKSQCGTGAKSSLRHS